MKFYKITLVMAAALLLFSCGGGAKQTDNGYIGKTYTDASELELFASGRDTPVRWIHFSKEAPEEYFLTILQADRNDYTAQSLYIFVYRLDEDGQTKTIVAELDIDRSGEVSYGCGQLAYTEDDDMFYDNFLYSRSDQTYLIKEVFKIDVENGTITAISNDDNKYFESV
ncbi:MAG: hypothetical protein LIO77_06010 [Rikenellaceae bacterium]|nr:hypothetical protein [Rikenellaceae bacterium]